MNRRNLLIAWGSMGVLGVGGRFGHQAFAREQLNRKLIETALSPLIVTHNRETQQLPQKTREEIRVWFHGKCLNAASFVRELGSGHARESLCALKDEKLRFDYLYGLFCAWVVSHGEIMNRIETIQGEVGEIIDANWSSCCFEISKSWGYEIRRHDSSFELGDLSTHLNPAICQQLEAAVHSLGSAGLNHDPAGKLFESLGRTATTMLVPMTRYPQIAIPTFLVVGMTHFFEYLYEKAHDPIGWYQAELTARLAHLGNRIADEFLTATKNQLAELHSFQDTAVRGQARGYAKDAVPTFI